MNRIQFHYSLASKVGILYLLMNIISISLFTWIISSSQLDLITDNTRYQAKELLASVVRNLHSIPAIPSSESGFNQSDEKYIEDNVCSILDRLLPNYALISSGTVKRSSATGIVIPTNFQEQSDKAKALRDHSGMEYHLVFNPKVNELQFYIPLDEIGLRHATIFTTYSTRDVGLRYSELYRLVIITVIILTIIHLLFGFLIYRLLIIPIRNLENATIRVAHGDFKAKVPVVRRDELGSLAAGFNYMMDVIDDAFTQVNRQVHLVQEANGRIQQMAVTDELTNLFNRRYFFEHLERSMALAIRHNQNLALILVDIDHFKNVNDQYGHLVGDIVLRESCSKLKECIRSTDILARYGGEEMILLLPQTDVKQAFTVAENLRLSIGGLVIQIPGSNELQITISLGVSELQVLKMRNQGSIPSYNQFIESADNALYQSKHNGRNRVTLADL